MLDIVHQTQVCLESSCLCHRYRQVTQVVFASNLLRTVIQVPRVTYLKLIITLYIVSSLCLVIGTKVIDFSKL